MPTPTRILLIADDAGDRATVGAALASSNFDYALVEAGDAAAGLAAARIGGFDCVLIDIRSPDPPLLDVVTQLTSAEGGHQAIVALTDDADPENALALLRAGALDSISRGEADAHTLARAIRYAKARGGFVVDLQAARADAEAKSRALDRLNRQTTVILSIIAHDLRNPFQVLLGMSELLVAAANAGDLDVTARRAAVVNEAAAQAHELLESLFAWASLHMDARAEPTAVSIAQLFQECVEAMQERADDKGVRLEAQPTDVRVLAQANAIAAILRNLVANALKFTDAGGQVTLAAARRDGQAVISVSDTGVGMSEAQAAKLFRFEDRSTSAGTGGERGAGLGLLLCRELAEWVGGALEVESALGQGTTLRLIVAAADAPGA